MKDENIGEKLSRVPAFTVRSLCDWRVVFRRRQPGQIVSSIALRLT